MELSRFDAASYWRLSSMIGQLLSHFQIAGSGQATQAGLTLSDAAYGNLGATLGEMQRNIEELRLPSAQKHFDRMKDGIFSKADGHSDVTEDWIARNLTELNSRLFDELADRLFLSLPPSQADTYLNSGSPFGNEVADKFPLMAEDIEEASKCLGLNRSTACVFHLMRVMELAVRQFGSKLGIALVTEKNWQVILDQINAAIKKLGNDPKASAYAEAASHLYNVKVAWRNQVMHPKQTYTFAEASVIFSNVKAFMIDLEPLL